VHLLERLSGGFDVSAHLRRDPLQFPHRFDDPADVEVAAFLAATLAFGRVAAFVPVLDHLFGALGQAPAAALIEGDTTVIADAASRRYRWLEPVDLAALLTAVGATLRARGSLQALFDAGDDGGEDTWAALGAFLGQLKADAMAAHAEPERRSRAVAFLFPSVRGAAACKRQHLFLRWMARRDGGDLGLWDLPTRRLVMPCDVHTARIGHALGFTSKPESSRRTANELTVALRRIDPEDPVRFDFAMAHVGISSGCKGRRVDPICSGCGLREACRWWGG